MSLEILRYKDYRIEGSKASTKFILGSSMGILYSVGEFGSYPLTVVGLEAHTLESLSTRFGMWSESLKLRSMGQVWKCMFKGETGLIG